MDAQRARFLLEACRNKRVLVIGDVMLDVYVEGVAERLNPEYPPAPLIKVRLERRASGGAGNVAKNLAALGADVLLVGFVGNDAAANELDLAAEREGYQASFIRSEGATTVKTRFLSGGHQLLRVDLDHVAEPSHVEAERVLAAARSKGYQALFLSDYAKGVLRPLLVRELIATARERGALSFADPKPSLGDAITGADIISPNLGEGRQLLGERPEDTKLGPSGTAHCLAQRFKSSVFLTLGAEGMCVCPKGSISERVPQEHRVAVADTSGCGDTAAAAILATTLAGGTPKEAAILGNAAAAVVSSHVGAVACTPGDVLGMFSEPRREFFAFVPIGSM